MKKVVYISFMVVVLILCETSGLLAQNDVLMINYINGETKSYIVNKLDKIDFVITTNIVSEKTDNSSDDIVIYPNPVAYYVNFKFSLNKAQKVDVVIYNILGIEMKRFNSQCLDVGENIVNWDGKNQHGLDTPAGTYQAILQIDNKIVSKLFQIMR